MESVFGYSAVDICGSLQTSFTPNIENLLENEEVVASFQTISCNPKEIIIDKTAVLQKKMVVKEKIIIPSQIIIPDQTTSVNLSVDNTCITETCTDEMDLCSQTSTGSKMELGSQESTDLRMELGSQESTDLRMEMGSQESTDLRIDTLSQEIIQRSELRQNVANEDLNLFNKKIIAKNYSVLPKSHLKRKCGRVSSPRKSSNAREALLLLRETAVASRKKAVSSHEELVKSLEDRLNNSDGINLKPRKKHKGSR